MKRTLPALLFLAAALATRLPILHRSVLDWDESLYFLMAQQWLAGHLPYTTIWDNKPIGIYAIFAAFQAVLPGVMAIRVATVLCVAVLATAVFHITQTLTRARGAGWVAGFMLILCSLSNDGLAANTELFMACCTALAVWAVLGKAPAWVAGLALGCGFMVKYVMAPEALCVLMLLWHQRGPRAAGGALAAAALPVFATVALYAAAGHLHLWWDCSVLSNLRRAEVKYQPGALQGALAAQAWRWGPLYLTALILTFTARRRGFVSNFPLLWLAAGLIGVTLPRSFFDHYFLEVLPPLCVLAGMFWSRIPTGGAPRDLYIGAIALLPLHAGWLALRSVMRPDVPVEIAKTLTAAQAKSLYIFDSQPIIYALTGLTPPTRFVLPSVLTGLTLPPVAAVNPLAEVTRILARAPQFIVRREPPPKPAKVDVQVYAALDAALAAHYVLAQRWPGAALYRRR